MSRLCYVAPRRAARRYGRPSPRAGDGASAAGDNDCWRRRTAGAAGRKCRLKFLSSALLDLQAKYGLGMALTEVSESLRTTVRPTPVFHTTPEPVGVRETSGRSLPVHAAGLRMSSTSGRLRRLKSVTSMKQS